MLTSYNYLVKKKTIEFGQTALEVETFLELSSFNVNTQTIYIIMCYLLFVFIVDPACHAHVDYIGGLRLRL